MNIETQLQEYRARKRKEATIANAKGKVLNFLGLQMDPANPDTVALLNSSSGTQASSSLAYEIEPEDITTETKSFLRYLIINPLVLLGIITWIILFTISVKYEWGAVFFVISALIGICLNTSTATKKFGELSAYSVFNKNCENIDGTLTAEQFEKELRFGPGSVR